MSDSEAFPVDLPRARARASAMVGIRQSKNRTVRNMILSDQKNKRERAQKRPSERHLKKVHEVLSRIEKNRKELATLPPELKILIASYVGDNTADGDGQYYRYMTDGPPVRGGPKKSSSDTKKSKGGSKRRYSGFKKTRRRHF